MSHSFARTLRRTGAQRVLTDSALARLAAEGDARSAEVLLSRHHDEMYRLVAGVAGDGPAASHAAAAATAAAHGGLAVGLPEDRPPRLSLLAFAYSCAVAAGPPVGRAPVAEMAGLTAPERAAMVLVGTIGLGSAAAAVVLGTTPEHVYALLRSAEADLTGFPPVGPACVDAREELPAEGALDAHAASCPPCAAFAVERAERARRLAAITGAALAAVGAAALGASVAAASRPLPRVELAVLGTLGAVVVSVGVTLGVVLTSNPASNVPAATPEDLRPRTLPLFPDVAEAERVQLVARLPTAGPASTPTRQVTRGLVTLRPILRAPAPSPSPQPPPPGTPEPETGVPAPGGEPGRFVPPAVAVAPPAVAVVPPPSGGPPSASGAPASPNPRRNRPEPARRKKLPPAVTPARVVVSVPPAPPVTTSTPQPPPAVPAPPPPVPLPRPHRGDDDDDDHTDDDHGYPRGDRDHGDRSDRGRDDDHDD